MTAEQLQFFSNVLVSLGAVASFGLGYIGGYLQ